MSEMNENFCFGSLVHFMGIVVAKTQKHTTWLDLVAHLNFWLGDAAVNEIQISYPCFSNQEFFC